MNLRRIGVLVAKEFRHGTSSLFFILAIVYPIVLSLLITLVFGDLFSQRPRLGVVDLGDSAVTATLSSYSQLEVIPYADEATLRQDVERGKVVGGVVLPTGLDETLRADASVELLTLRWGQALAKDLALIDATVDRALLEVGELPQPIQVTLIPLGKVNTTTWEQRLVPLLVLLTILIGGTMLPASALVDEKQHRTLGALVTTPTTLMDVYLSKMVVGVSISTVMGIVVLLLNRSLGDQPMLLLGTLLISAVGASAFGILIGSMLKDSNALMATFKSMGLLLYAPALVELFPRIPNWVAWLFPSYYIMNPVIEVSQNGAGVAEISWKLMVLCALIGTMILIMVKRVEYQQQQLALAK
jgi:ABC-2 type transport system permease protein